MSYIARPYIGKGKSQIGNKVVNMECQAIYAGPRWNHAEAVELDNFLKM